MNKTFQCSIKHVYFILLLISSSLGFSQTRLNEEISINLPPGSAMPIKFEFIDYSYKLDNVSSTKLNSLEEKNFLEEFSEQDLIEMKLNSVEKYQYYMKAKLYYNNLSNKIKTLYTVNELWYIYMFDFKLTNKIKSM
jgi:hypothetical protein